MIYAAASFAICGLLGLSNAVEAKNVNVPYVRPAEKDRTFSSPAIDTLINELKPLFKDPNMATLFENCLPNSLDTTILYHTVDPLDSFVITGDIEAMWLRDSTNQLIPYVPYATQDSKLASLLEGLIARQANSVLIDPFANAFNYNASGAGHQDDNRKPRMGPAVFEGKYEIDSIAAFLKVSYWYWRYTDVTTFMTDNWFKAVTSVLTTIESMIETDGEGAATPYLFQRMTSVSTDTLMISGRGPPARKCGLTRSLFRPSDDAVTLPYNIPGNAMACTELVHLQQILSKTQLGTEAMIATAKKLSDSICGALSDLIQAEHGGVLPYEVDGYKSSYYMDDANIPSLLSLPVLGFVDASNKAYQSTRKYVLSEANPFYFKGVEGEGVGGPHVGYKYAWPMAIVMRSMTSTDDAEIQSQLDLLIKSAISTGFMHESFNVENVDNYTRSWFAWANGLLGELVLQLINERPYLLINEADIAKAQSLVKVPISVQAQKEPVLTL